MVRPTTGKPPTPSVAERARTIAARGGRAVLLRGARPRQVPPSGHHDRIEPHLHHVHPDGSVTVLLADGHPLVAATASPAMVEIADRAPVALREPVRGLLWITGLLRCLDADEARERAVAVAEDHPDTRLLDVGHGFTALVLSPLSLVLADGDGTDSMRPEDFSDAAPDPFCAYEDHWLRHLEIAHRDVVGMLTRLLPESLRGGHIRPLGLDRHGLRLRVEADSGDHDVRLAFSRPVDTPGQLGMELRRLVGCPFLAATRNR